MLEVKNIHLSFGGIKALQGVNFRATKGAITGIVGPNGAGKTSLFNVISGFYAPQQGTVEYAGVDITHQSADKMAAMGIARTFQNIALFRGMTVLDNIKLGAHSLLHTDVWSALRFFGFARQEELDLRRKIEEEVIDFLEIDHIRKAPITSLSYGLQKRVELGRALAMRPKLLMLDEPVAGMNREETGDMARFILDVQEKYGTTILLVEHDMNLVMDICSQIIVLNFGKQIASGTPNEIASNHEVVEAYLGSSVSA